MAFTLTPAELRSKLLMLLKGKCLNGFQVCRLLNNLPEDPARCHTLNDPAQGANHFFKCASSLWDCGFPYFYVLRRLDEMEKMGWIQSTKMKWWDSRGGKKSTDIFRFFYVSRSDFEKRFGENLDRWLNV